MPIAKKYFESFWILKMRMNPRIHNIMLIRIVIWHDVIPYSFLRKQKTSVNLLQIEMDRPTTKVNAMIWNRDDSMTFEKYPKNKGTKNNASNNVSQMIDVSQKRKLKLLGSVFLLLLLINYGSFAFALF